MGSMRLESVEIVGFKSFCDKQELSFKGGVTGIVGPNGCGKSNISDAISWVLGEQSVKSLRGSSMEDVIFAGSQSRQPLAMAEVNLKVSGLNGNSPDDSPDCVVTRRLYRNGESEYLMNGHVCRLRDVHELFMDTGLGSKAYSIIEQARGPPRPHRGGGRDHQVQGPPPADPAQAGGRPAEPAPRQRHRPRGGKAAREPEAPGQQGSPLPGGARGDAGGRAGALRPALPRSHGALAHARRAPRRRVGAGAGGHGGPGDRGSPDGGAPPGPLRGGGTARGGAGAAERPDPRRGPLPGQERLRQGPDRGDGDSGGA